MIERRVRYFEQPGKRNTAQTIEAVRAYLAECGEAAALVIASISGETAVKVKDAMKGLQIPLVCVTGAPSWQNLPEYHLPLIPLERRAELEEAGVVVVDCVPSSLSDTIEFSYARYGFRSPTWLFVEALLAMGGYGLKTAVECVLVATDGGFITPFKDVVSVAGTDKGADTAIVVRSTFSSTVFSSDPKKRLVLKELLAVPREKIFYSTVGPGAGEWQIEEARKQVGSGEANGRP